ncbi:MAG TPA: 3'-5' exonuclease [Longimicrobiaceae bacterium]|nr:3'-5' exonuclease [Longimicrobiaceae bacterium]
MTEGIDSSGLAFERTGGLLETAACMLQESPLSTAEVAARVLHLRGSPGAAASAVFALLGDDPRFEVDAAGVWSIRGRPSHDNRALREEDWVVVDVETTGGSPQHGHRITEVAAVRVSGGEIRSVFSTLVNPERSIPRMITGITGITDEMVAGAPTFREIAPQLASAMQGKVFVAHNAAFDWRFVCAELERSSGQRLAGRSLCTVRLARKLLPQLPSRTLGALADYFGLEIASRHRAEDDAVATAYLLLRLIEMLADHSIEDWSGVEGFLRKRAPRRKRQARPRSMESV